jgi:hypothetical protein
MVVSMATAVMLLGGTAAQAVPWIWIDHPQNEQLYCSGITSAQGTVTVDPGVAVDRVYVMLYYYSVGNYNYVYWNWVTQAWQIGSSWDTMKLATGTDAWSVDSGFPPELLADPERTYALYARAYDTGGGVGANVHYFYVGDYTPPTIDLTILRPTISPANGKLVLAATVAVDDNCTATPGVTIAVTSTAPPKPPKPGKPKPDWQIIQDGDYWQIWLRAENDGRRQPRTYTIDVAAVDGSSNGSRAAGTVVVP